MKKIFLTLMTTALIAFNLAACGWKPSVTAVPLTAPWTKMNLLVKENAIVWSITPTEFKAVHKDDKKAVLAKYTDNLKADGWKLEKFDDKTADKYYVEMTKGADGIQIEIYDFENTGVIIRKK